jgi:hypothetical protein
VTFTVVSGTIYAVRLGGFTSAHQVGSLSYTAGTYTVLKTVPAGSNTVLYISSNNSAGSIDNVSIKEVFYNDPTGTLKLISHPIDKPRVEYDANGVAKGLLIEEARTNSLSYSNDFTQWTNSAWTTVTPNAGASPDGTQNATLLTSGSGDGYVYRSISLTAGQTWTFSVWLKSDSPASFDIDIQIFTGTDSGNTKTITVTNEWQRFYVTKTVTQTTNYLFLIGGVVGGVQTFRDESLYVYGAQAELGSFPTSYIPTSGATATRSADLASVNVSEFGYNQVQGSVVVDFEASRALDSNAVLVNPSDGTTSNRMTLWGGTTSGTTLFVVNSGVAQASLAGGIPAAGTHKTAIAYATNDFALTLDAGAIQSYTLGTVPTVSQIDIGRYSNDLPLNGHIKSIKYYPLRLSDAKLQELTS